MLSSAICWVLLEDSKTYYVVYSSTSPVACLVWVSSLGYPSLSGSILEDRFKKINFNFYPLPSLQTFFPPNTLKIKTKFPKPQKSTKKWKEWTKKTRRTSWTSKETRISSSLTPVEVLFHLCQFSSNIYFKDVGNLSLLE